MSFASFPLDSLDLPPPLLAVCIKAGLFNASDVLLPSISDLARRLRPHLTGFNHSKQVTDLISAVARSISPAIHTAAEGYENRKGKERAEDERGEHAEDDDGRWVSTGDEEIDQLLGGGVRLGVLTELVGESAAGKSHMCMSLALAAQVPTLSKSPGGAIVLTSERELPTSRLVEIARSLIARSSELAVREGNLTGVEAESEPGEEVRKQGGSGSGRGAGTPSIKTMLDNVHTTRCQDIDALDHALSFVIPHMLASRLDSTHSPMMGQLPPSSSGSDKTATSTSNDNARSAGAKSRSRSGAGTLPIRLIILDSITALLRGETASTSAGLTQRSRHLCAVADKLKALAVEYDLAVVVVNQVSDVFKPLTSSLPNHDADDDDEAEREGRGFNRAKSVVVAGPGTGPRNASPSTGGVSATAPSVQAPSQPAWNDREPPPPMLYATQARWFSGQSSTVHKEASLGIVWANAVNTRIMLARTGRRRMLVDADIIPPKRWKAGDGGAQSHSTDYIADNGNTTVPSSGAEASRVVIGYNIDDTKPTLIRRLFLVFSPFASPATIDYTITPSGVHTIPGSTKAVDLSAALKRRDAAAATKVVERSAQEAGAPRQGQGMGQGKMGYEQIGVGQEEEGAADEDEFEREVFDDFGDLPAGFWDGKFDEMLTAEPLAEGVVD